MRLILRDRGGVALLLALVAISFLVAVTVRLTENVDLQMQSAVNHRSAVRLDGMLFSGLNIARAALLADQQQNDFDSARDDWATLDQGLLSSLAGGDRLQVMVGDLSGRLQINALVLGKEQREKIKQEKPARGKSKPQDFEKLQRAVWLRFLTSGGFAIRDQDEAVALVDALSDWIDADDDERDHGAENGYYAAQEPAYGCRNGPLLYPEELLLVKGFSRKILYGDKEHPGIIDYVTTAGRDGKININTAPVQVLQALADNLGKEDVQALVDFREDADNEDLLVSPDWYKKVSDFPGDVTLDNTLITTSSSWFRITVSATVGQVQRRAEGLLQRHENEEQTLVYWAVR